MLGGKLAKRFLDGARLLPRLHLRVDRRRVRGEVLGGFGRVAGRRPAGAQRERLSDRHAVDPGRQPRLAAEGAQLVEGGEERVLHRVLGEGALAAELEADAKDPRSERLVDLPASGLAGTSVPFAGPGENLRFDDGHFPSRSCSSRERRGRTREQGFGAEASARATRTMREAKAGGPPPRARGAAVDANPGRDTGEEK